MAISIYGLENINMDCVRVSAGCEYGLWLGKEMRRKKTLRIPWIQMAYRLLYNL
jgi:hypothetical protein